MSTVAVLLWLLLPAQAAGAPMDPSALSGLWEGVHARSQAGECKVGNGPRQLNISVSVEPDGSLRVQQAGTSSDFDWVGRVAGGDVVFEVPRRSTCDGNVSRTTSTLSGALPDDKGGKRRLTLRGTDAPCPAMGCRFANKVTLTWKGPLPKAER